ncbi:MAG: ImmA/IrrE family metallo-endopeptidase [archaeon]
MTDNIYKINPNRLNYLIMQYNLTENDLLDKLNITSSGKYRKRNIITKDIFTKILEGTINVSLDYLKRFDSIFEKGLTWYITTRNIPFNKNNSIFFRKDKFNAEMDLETKKKIDFFEQKKFEISYLSNLVDYNLERKIERYNLKDNPYVISKKIYSNFEKLNLKVNKNQDKDRYFLEWLIRVIESHNVFVFEFIENHNVKNPVNFSGFFLKPNFIVLKRQKQLRREIFTLLHEFAHYLLDCEDIDNDLDHSKPNTDVENWCNNFAYCFLEKDSFSEFERVNFVRNNSNLKNFVNNLHNKTYLSYKAIYTRLKIENKITDKDYDHALDEIQKSMDTKKEKAKIDRELLKEQGKIVGFGKPKAIRSNLFASILKENYFSGNVDENRICSSLNLKGRDQFDKFIYS